MSRQEVFPLYQSELLPDGQTKTVKVRPLTYALMSYIKGTMKLEDTIEISEDEDSSEWNVKIGDDDFELYVNCHENSELYTVDLYFGSADSENFSEIIASIAKLNNHLISGHFQYIEGHIRYHNSCIVSEIASRDPNYEGPHILPPNIVGKMIDYAIRVSGIYGEDIKVLLD